MRSLFANASRTSAAFVVGAGTSAEGLGTAWVVDRDVGFFGAGGVSGGVAIGDVHADRDSVKARKAPAAL